MTGLVPFLLSILQCAAVVNLGGEIGCMISEGPWVFVGLPNLVKVRWESTLHFSRFRCIYASHIFIKFLF